MSLRSFLVVSATSVGVSNIYEAKNLPLLFAIESRMRKMWFLNGGPLPPLSTKVDKKSFM